MNKIVFGNIQENGFYANEAFKTLRTNIEFAGENIKVIAFTSCQPNEGKTSTVFKLANSMALSGNKVLFIDADIRKSVFVSRYKVDKPGVGLTEFLVGKVDLTDIVNTTNVSNLHVILTGPVSPNTSELLGSNRFQKMIEALKKVYDYVLIDCPPLGSVIDAAVVSKNSDGAVLIVESENVSYKFAQKVKQQLEQSGVKIIGAVLNKVKMSGGKGYGKYYNKYYGKYYGKHYGNEYEDDKKIKED